MTSSRSLGRPKSRVIRRPGQFDRPFLEIVAEREVAEHLEEGVVAGGVADIVQVVVLAAGAHALLRRGGARGGPGLGAGEDVLERHHAGVDEQQCGSRCGTSGADGHHRMVVRRRSSPGRRCGSRSDWALALRRSLARALI